MRRIRRQQMLLEDQRDDQERRRQEGAHRSPHPGPESEREQNTASAFSASRRPMIVGVMKCPSRKVRPPKRERRHQAAADGREGDQPHHDQHHEHRDRPDDRDEVERRRQRAEPGRIGHAGERADEAGADADADIDEGDGQQIIAEMDLDLVENTQRAQARVAIAEVS